MENSMQKISQNYVETRRKIFIEFRKSKIVNKKTLSKDGLKDELNKKYGTHIKRGVIDSYERVAGSQPAMWYLTIFANYFEFASYGQFVAYVEKRMNDNDLTLEKFYSNKNVEKIVSSLDQAKIDTITIKMK